MLAGATGLVGGECLRLLLAEPEVALVRVLSRRRPDQVPADPRLELELVDFARLAERSGLFDVDSIVCALGTTIRKAGSRAAFRAVDYELPLALARLGRERGARHFVLVSSLGANPRSRFFYSRVKGDLEDAVASLGYPALTILRPSLLLGERTEFRLGEAIAKRLAWLVPGPAAPIHARDVAAAAVRQVLSPPRGRLVLSSSEMRARR